MQRNKICVLCFLQCISEKACQIACTDDVKPHITDCQIMCKNGFHVYYMKGGTIPFRVVW